MTKAVAFLATRDPPRCRRFYTETLGLRCLDEDDFALVFDAHGTKLRVRKVDELVPLPHTVFGLEVDDIEASVDTLLAQGVVARRYPHVEQDARGIWTAPSGVRVFWFPDPDGNLLSLSTSE